VVSPADSRCTAFDTVTAATELWIKGRNFSLAKLFNGNFGNLQGSALFEPLQCCIAVFRLAPQDYHRFHAPVSGTVTLIKHISGEYYTVNPMAVRLELDVFGENVRTLVAIETADFGTVIMVAVGAMMVGLIVLTVGEGDRIARGDEVGYFKFGGSTILVLFAKARFAFDTDIVDNSAACIETLVRVGQSVGHSPQIAQCLVDHIDFDRQLQDFKLNLIRVLTGGDLSTARELSNWEATKLQFD
jgi:phosphatidylserine decarboxylase